MSSSKNVLVTGATGPQGRGVVPFSLAASHHVYAYVCNLTAAAGQLPQGDFSSTNRQATQRLIWGAPAKLSAQRARHSVSVTGGCLFGQCCATLCRCVTAGSQSDAIRAT
ncbi:hypothetical protein BJX68DRAFT_263612 [Aspergillus pseudodeflectus]|uniref:NmrA-like domain-containing protein n=1 Tax=Aspergillus pseudodeflectus TaxID=176178 RepID=A0ABR4KV26_9EURO